jgi:hyperosmotically inducible periplasmic protein
MEKYRMTHSQTKVTFLSMIFLTSLFLNACTSLVTETAMKAFEDRSTEDQVTDAKIVTGILQRLSDKDKGLLLDVGVDVWEQRVMLTGALENTSLKSEVEKLAREDSRIRTLYNDIQLASAQDIERRRKAKEEGGDSKGGVGETVSDFWIETKVKAQLITLENVSSVNFRWRSVLNHVYVIGRAANPTEKELVLDVIKKTEGVSSVTEYIKIVTPK